MEWGSLQMPSEQPASIECYESDATRDEFNTQNSPLVLSRLGIQQRSIFGCLVLPPP
jgi:hypothetical protein